jgi:hypothetical protein
MSLPGVGTEQILDQFLDDGIRGVVGGELVEVMRGFESFHEVSLLYVGHKKTDTKVGGA